MLILDRAKRAQAFDLAVVSMADRTEQRAANRLIEEKNVREAIRVTVVGVIRARRADLTDIDGKAARMFGHLGVYPAQILVRAIQDVSVIDAPEFPSNMDPSNDLGHVVICSNASEVIPARMGQRYFSDNFSWGAQKGNVAPPRTDC